MDNDERIQTVALVLGVVACGIILTALLATRPADAGLQRSELAVPVEVSYGCGQVVVSASAAGAMVLMFDHRRRLLEVLEVAGPDWGADLRYQDARAAVTCEKAISW